MDVLSGPMLRTSLRFDMLIDAIDQGHKNGVVSQADSHLSHQGAGYLVRSAWIPGGALGTKLTTIFPDNLAKGDLPSIQGIYLLFDGIDGRPLAVMDGTELTYWKTAADSALGGRYLARADAKTILLVGAGALGPWLVRGHLAVHKNIEQVRVWNRTAERAEAVTAELISEGIPAVTESNLQRGVENADIVTAATLSSEPLILGQWLAPGTHLDLVGGFRPDMRETDDTAMAKARVFVNCRETTIEQAGDIVQAIASGAIGPDDVLGDLYDLAAGANARLGDTDITIYKNTGGAHLDLMVARAAYDLIIGRVEPGDQKTS